MTGCRIGRVRMKDGGADVRVLPSRKAEGVKADMLGCARWISDKAPDLVAYVVVGLAKDGHIYSGAKTTFSADFPVNRHMFVGMITETVRDDLIGRRTACDVINEANGYSE